MTDMLHMIVQDGRQGTFMREEDKIKSALLRTLCALLVCMTLIIMKFVLKDEKIVEELYNYLATDIVFLG